MSDLKPRICGHLEIHVPDDDCSDCDIKIIELRREMDGKLATKVSDVEAGYNIQVNRDGDIVIVSSLAGEQYSAGNHIIIAEGVISADLADYYNKTEVNELIEALENIEIVVVDELPDEGETNKIYFVPKSATSDEYYEFVWLANGGEQGTGGYEMIGDTAVDLSTYATLDDLANGLDTKQNKLNAGTNITISNGVISAVDTTYTAGTNVQISPTNVISATDTKYTAGQNVTIDSNNVISAVDTTYTAGQNIAISTEGEISTPSYTGQGIISVSNDKKISADMTNYYTKDNLYTKAEIDALLADGFEFVPVDTLPAVGDSSNIYLLATADPDIRDMYVWNDNRWKKIGSTGVSLNGVVKTTGTLETYDEHTITVWQENGRIYRLNILGIGWKEVNTIASGDGYGSGSPGADTGGAVTP